MDLDEASHIRDSVRLTFGNDFQDRALAIVPDLAIVKLHVADCNARFIRKGPD